MCILIACRNNPQPFIQTHPVYLYKIIKNTITITQLHFSNTKLLSKPFIPSSFISIHLHLYLNLSSPRKSKAFQTTAHRINPSAAATKIARARDGRRVINAKTNNGSSQ